MTTFSQDLPRPRVASSWRVPSTLAVVAVLLLVFASATAAQTEPAAPAAEHEAAAEHAGEEAHEESLGAFLSRVANFLILAGGLYYLLKSPIKDYLDGRGQQIRSELHQAAQLRTDATRQMADIDARLKALPGEIEALKRRGKDEIASEQARIKQAAEVERQRLVEQTRREIDRQLQIARRDLTAHAADLAVAAARERLSRELRPDDQLRLVDRYAAQVAGGRHE
ncbi:MAG: hypothetical protein AB7I50_10570 [Vicinamibacterales bacterium]